MEILEKNLKEIEKHNPILAAKIKTFNFNQDTKFELSQAASGDTNLIYNNILLHDANDPQKEAIDAFNLIRNTSKDSITIIMGLGLGYLLKRFFISSQNKIVVYEPNLDILKFTLQAVDFSNELSEDRIYFANNRIELDKILNKIYAFDDSLNISGLKSCLQLYPQEVDYLKQNLPDIKKHLESNYECLFKQSFRWAQMGMLNTPNLAKSYNIDALKDSLTSKPALIVSSGPSLDNNLQTIKKYKDKAVIFAASNSLKALDKNEITPHFLSFIDAAGEIKKQVDKIDISNINLIALPVVFHTTFEQDFKRKFIFYSNNDLFSRWISEKTGFSIEDYENKGNVSYCMLYSAFKMGCSPIILIGQDFAFTDGKSYSSDSAYGSLILTKDKSTGKYKFELQESDEFLEKLLSKRNEEIESDITSVQGQNGEMLPTKLDYSSFIKYFEEFAYQNPDLKLINSSSGGAQINGFENIQLDELLSKIEPLNINLDTIINKALEEYQNPLVESKEELKASIKALIEDINKYLPLAKDGQDKAVKLLRELKKKPINKNNIMKLSNSLLSYYADFKDNLFDVHQLLIGCVFQELFKLTKIMEGEANSNGIEDLQNIAEASRFFYFVFLRRVELFRNSCEKTLEKYSKSDL